MRKSTLVACAAAALAAVAAAASSSAGSPDETGKNVIMTPGKGLVLAVGNKRAVSYFETKANSCDLTVVVAAADGGETGTDTPGTRIVATVSPGNKLRVDTPASKSAEFLCGPAGHKMNARVIDRPPYSSFRS